MASAEIYHDISIIYLMAGGAVTLTGKIVWDWLLKKNPNGSTEYRPPCDFHHEMVNNITQDRICISTIRQDITEIKTDLKWIKESMERTGKK